MTVSDVISENDITSKKQTEGILKGAANGISGGCNHNHAVVTISYLVFS